MTNIILFMNNKDRRKLFLVFMFFFVFTNWAQSEETIKFLTMEDAVSRALIDNNLIRANKYGVKKANWDVKRAWAEMIPTISFNTRYNWIDKQTFVERDFRQYLPPELASQIPQTVFQESYYSSFDINMPLFNGTLINGLSIAYEQETMSELLSKSTKQQVLFNVITSYLKVLKSKDIVEIQNKYLELSKLNYEKAQRLFKANRYSKNEALRWKIDLQQQKSIVKNSEADFRNSLLGLSRLINAKLKQDLVIDPKILSNIENEKNIVLDLNDNEILLLIDLSDDELVKTNASLSASKSGEEISRLLHKESYSSYMPNVNFTYSYAWRENGTVAFDDYNPKNLMINFSVPIFSGFQNFTALKSTLYEYKKTQEEFKNQILNVKLVLNNVANNIINTKTQLELHESNFEYNKNNYAVVERRREKGLVSNIDYIDAKLNMQNANIELVANSYNFITSVVELYFLIGKIESLVY